MENHKKRTSYHRNEVWERLGFKGFDSSILSKALSGERLLGLAQLNALCDLLSLPNHEKKYLEECLQIDHIQRYGFDIVHTTYKDKPYLDLLEASIAQISTLDRTGQVKDVVEFSEVVIRSLKLKLDRLHEDKVRRNVLYMFGDVVRFYSENMYYYKSSKFIYPDKARSVRWLQKIALELKSSQYLELSKFKLAEIYYVNRDSRKALKIFNRVDLDVLPDYEKLIGLKDLAVSLALTNQLFEYELVKSKLLTLVGIHLLDYQVAVFDGLARCEALFSRFSLAVEYLETAWRLIKLIQPSEGHYYQRCVQLLRSQLRLLDVIGEGASSEFKSVKKEALLLAGTMHLQNFADEIISIGTH